METTTKALAATIDLTEYRKTGDYNHYISLMTSNLMRQSSQAERLMLLTAFLKTKRGDHFYVAYIGDRKFYIAENGQGYTVMLPEDY